MAAGIREQPLVSVGMPVFNEEKRLASALASILAQDYPQLEVIVCDNSSTDSTLAIARDFASRDNRVRVYSSEVNRGAIENFNRCFRLAEGAYFTWASGHDTRLPEAIGKCVRVLEDDSSVVLCYPRASLQRFDGGVEQVGNDTLETRALPTAARLHRTIGGLVNCNLIHGVIRSSSLARTRLCRPCFRSDHVLLAELSVLGAFHQIDDVLFVRADNRPSETEEQWQNRIPDMLGVRRGIARSRPTTAMSLEHVIGVWLLSPGPTKLTNAARAALWCGRRWRFELLREWRLLSFRWLLMAARIRLRRLNCARVRQSEQRPSDQDH